MDPGLRGSFTLAACVAALMAESPAHAEASNGLPAAGQRSATKPTTAVSKNPEAAAVFAHAEDLLKQGDPRTGGSFKNAREAIKLYERSAALDPHLARAFVQIARAWIIQGYSDPDAPSADEINRQSKLALTRALKIDPNLAEAHAVRASIYYQTDYNWKAAEREYRWAIRHDPKNALVHSGLAQFLGTMARFKEALEQARLARDLRHSPIDTFVLARLYYSMRDYRSAVEYCRQSLAAQDNQAVRFFLGLMLLAQGSREEGLAELKQAADQKNNNAGAILGLAYGYALDGRRADALSLIDQVAASHTDGTIPAYRRAAVYVALGDKTKAIADLWNEYRARGNWIIQLKVDPVMDPLRKDAGFLKLLRQMRFQ